MPLEAWRGRRASPSPRWLPRRAACGRLDRVCEAPSRRPRSGARVPWALHPPRRALESSARRSPRRAGPLPLARLCGSRPWQSHGPSGRRIPPTVSPTRRPARLHAHPAFRPAGESQAARRLGSLPGPPGPTTARAGTTRVRGPTAPTTRRRRPLTLSRVRPGSHAAHRDRRTRTATTGYVMTAGMRLGIVDHRGPRSARARCACGRSIAIIATTNPHAAGRSPAHPGASLGFHARDPRSKGAPRHVRPTLQSP